MDNERICSKYCLTGTGTSQEYKAESLSVARSGAVAKKWYSTDRAGVMSTSDKLAALYSGESLRILGGLNNIYGVGGYYNSCLNVS